MPLFLKTGAMFPTIEHHKIEARALVMKHIEKQILESFFKRQYIYNGVYHTGPWDEHLKTTASFIRESSRN